MIGTRNEPEQCIAVISTRHKDNILKFLGVLQPGFGNKLCKILATVQKLLILRTFEVGMREMGTFSDKVGHLPKTPGTFKYFQALFSSNERASKAYLDIISQECPSDLEIVILR